MWRLDAIIAVIAWTGFFFGSAEAAEHTLAVKLAGLLEAYPTGASVPLSLSVQNISTAPWSLDGVFPVPSGLVVTVVGSDGKRVPFRGPVVAPGGPPLPTPLDEVYKVPPGETILLAYDLATLFDLSRADLYVLTLRDAGGIVAQERFAVVNPRIISSRGLSGGLALVGSIRPAIGQLASCSASVIEINNQGSASRFLSIDNVIISDNQSDSPASLLRLSPAAELLDARMDCLGQVWFLLKDAEKNSLVSWSVINHEFKTLIPTTDERIEIGATNAGRGLLAQVVIAGIPGKLTLTSLSLSSKAFDNPITVRENERKK